MKHIYLYILAISCSFFTACDSDSTEGLSKVTNYAVVTLKGDPVVVVNQGDTYTDAGADSEIAGAKAEVTIAGAADTSKPGVYKINYETINEDGFPARAQRTVIVLSSAPSAFDLSGNWKRTNESPVTIVKLTDRSYTHDNAGGVQGANQLMVTFYNIDDKQLYIPLTKNASSTGIIVESLAGEVVDNDNFNWSLSANSFYGTFTRRFVRQ